MRSPVSQLILPQSIARVSQEPGDFDSVVRRFRIVTPDRFNFISDVIRPWSARSPDADALVWTDGKDIRRLTFSELSEAASRAASILSRLGIRRGDTVLIILGRDFHWWELMLGCLQLGAIASPGTTQLTAADIAYRIGAAGARAVISNSACAERIEKATSHVSKSERCRLILVDGNRQGWSDYRSERNESDPNFDVANTSADDEALCYFTSGTTGYPKMTVHAHRYPLGHLATGLYWLGLEPGDLCWNLSDTGWAKAAWSSLCAPWLAGAAVMAVESDGFDATATLQILERFSVTCLCAPPTAYRMLVQLDLSSWSVPSLKRCVAAGEPLNPGIIESWERTTGLQILDGYGQTETTLLCGNFGTFPVRPGSMGRPAPGIDLAVIDNDARTLPPGEEGDIALRVGDSPPPGLFKGYRNDPVQTAACRRGPWYLTGDRATVDEEGYFWFVGRSDDVILSSGYRIGPFEVENALISHQAVAESAVVSSPDAERGEVVKAFVVLTPGIEGNEGLARQLQDHVKSVTAPYKYPRKIEFVTELPKTVSGKIKRNMLRAKEWEIAGRDSTGASRID